MEGVAKFLPGDNIEQWLSAFSNWLENQPELDALLRGEMARKDVSSSVLGAVTATGAVTLNSTLDVAGATTLDSTLNVAGAAVLSSTVNIDGATDIDGTLDVLSDITAQDDVIVTGTVSAADMVLGGATPDSKAILECISTAKVFLPPRMTATQRDNIVSPPTGSVIFCTSTSELNIFRLGAWYTV
jgi:hypothetical protein